MAEYSEYICRTNTLSSPAYLGCEDNSRQPCGKGAINAVRQLILKSPTIGSTRTDDEFILRFLRARKCNVPDAFELLCNYCSYRQQNSSLFEKFGPTDTALQQALRDGFPGVLPQRDRRGRRVLVIFAANWDPSSYDLLTIYKAILYSLEKLIELPRNQVSGFIFIVDWSGFSFSQSSKLNPRVLKLMINGLQDCFPARFKGVHFINQPWYVEAALTVIRPFLKEKTREKIYLHGNNMSTLHECIARDVLPAELGGEGPSYNQLSWADKVLEAEDGRTDNNTVQLTPPFKRKENSR
ncbi:clavesin-2-like [Schistocerca gregaria]|uniref:clavesin-2-like n=1 Tax=Schistocerca gregaria TaxID=7010 RepID=UPI00211F1BCA|nr:clavesin-2-like [Schistocerca gregaria]XP_049856036.1 clavesin-2-like [Schistocerca gregaria]XP_049856037.1 clavesin-2-like [Schistocerca gregaria]